MKEPVMRPRLNKPETTPCGRFCGTPVERQVTSFIGGWRATRFASPVTPGVLALLFARKNRLSRLEINGLTSQRLFHLPDAQRIFRLKFRP